MVRTSARLTEPAISQRTFSKVTQKSVAKKRKSVRRLTRSRMQVGQLLDPRPPRQPLTLLGREDVAVEAAGPPARDQAFERGADSGHVLRADDDPGAGLAQKPRRLAVRRDGRQDRPLGGEVLEDLPGEHGPAAPFRFRDQQEERLGVPLQLQRLAMARVRDELEAVPQPQPVRPLAVGGAEVADEAGNHVQARFGERGQERTGASPADEAAGVRDPEALGGRVVEPLEVLVVAAVGDRHYASLPARGRASPPRSARRRRLPHPRASRRGARPRRATSPSAPRPGCPPAGARARAASRGGRRST